MAIQISPKSQKLIEELVASGRYADTETAVEAAIAILAEQERKLAWLKAELAIAQEQVDRGELIEFTADRVEYLKDRARENARAGKPMRDAVIP
jgi:Arc/MetJ-type ribon-helix-helix transcriptional regulator